MAEDDKESKTEEPTEKRRSESREKGRTAKSTEVNSVIIIITSTAFFTFLGMVFIRNILLFWREMFANVATFDVTPDAMHALLALLMPEFFYLVLPFMFTLALAGVASNVWQNDGWIFSFDPLSPKWSKVNPLQGWKKFMGKEGAMNLLKALVKLGIISVAVWASMDDELSLIPILMESPVIQTLQILGWETLDLVTKVIIAMIVIAAIDFVWQKYQFTENLKMTKQEVKDERKQQEGDPTIKMRQRQKQFEMHRNRMMAAVPEAEVIITNPTHLSVALRYDRLRDHAPVVVAKGAGHVAMRIRELAKEHDIPLVEDKPLARTLFKNVDIGEAIPDTLYKAVAEILAYVYRLKHKIL